MVFDLGRSNLVSSVFNKIRHVTIGSILVKQEIRLFIICIVSISVLYVVQIISPLRLSSDVIVYLSMAESALKGQGFSYHGSSTHYPPGYPAIIALLIYLDIGSSSVFIMLNLVFLTIGHAAAFYICMKYFNFDKKTSYTVLLLLLLSFVFIIQVPFALSDLVFYGVSMTALGCLINMDSEEYSWIFVLCSISLSIAAFQIRTIGIALLLPVFFKMLERLYMSNTYITFKSTKVKTIILIIITSTMLTFLGIFIINHAYTTEALLKIMQQGGGIIDAIGKIWITRIEEVGELIINFPISRITNLFTSLTIVVGIIGILVTGYGIYLRKDELSSIDYYFTIYGIILFCWPHEDVRFWLPIMPFSICYAIIAFNGTNSSDLLITAARIYIIIFTLSGLVVLAYTTRLSLSGSRYPEMMRDKKYYLEYKLLVSNKPLEDKFNINKDAVNILKKYGFVNKWQRYNVDE